MITGNLIFTVSNEGYLYAIEKNKGNIIRDSVEITKKEPSIDAQSEVKIEKTEKLILEEANKKSEKVMTGANKYADYVLANLQLVTVFPRRMNLY